MTKIIKNNTAKTFIILFIFLTVWVWLFSGWPQIWRNPPIPPEIKEAHAVQAGRPDEDITTGSWTDEGTVDNDGLLYTSIDEVAADGDDSYIVSLGTITTAEVGLPALQDPGVDTGHIIHVWIRSIGSGVPERMRAALYQGTTMIEESGNFVNRSGTYAEQTFTITEANAANITDYADLRISIISVTLGGIEEMRVTKVELEIPDAVVPGVITVGTTGNQTATMDIPSTNNYIGGAFTFVRDAGITDITQIIITETGTVDANSNLSNLDIYYETAAICSYEGTETLFGTAASFGASEAVVSGTMSVGTSQVCAYVVLDVGAGASEGETLEIEISDPSAEVTVSIGSVSPVTPVAIAGFTTLQVPAVPSATWRETEDVPTSGVNKSENIRLRIEITNTGSEATDYDYLLEYAPKVGAICGDDESFIVVPVTAATEHFEMTDSTYFANGDPTTARLTVPGGFTFVSGRMVEDLSNSSGNITLPFEYYTEIEFVFQATTNAANGSSYCFRLTNAEVTLDEYTVYPELQIVL